MSHPKDEAIVVKLSVLLKDTSVATIHAATFEPAFWQHQNLSQMH